MIIGIVGRLAWWAGTAGRPTWHTGWHPRPSMARSFWVMLARPATVLGRASSTSIFSSRAIGQNGRPGLLDRSIRGG